MHWIFSRYLLADTHTNEPEFASAKQKQLAQPIANQRGQGLIEYLVITALMGVATIAIVRTMGSVVTSRFASVTEALQGQKYHHAVTIDKKAVEKERDMNSFFTGVSGSTGLSKAGGAGASEGAE